MSYKRELTDTFNMNLFSTYRSVMMGIATLLVVFHHLTFKVSGTILSDAYMFARHLGAMGVDLFLFVSGFGLYYSFSKRNNIKDFYIKRLQRILPTFFIIAVPIYIYIDLIKGEGDILQFFKDIFLVSYWLDGNGNEWFIAAILVLYFCFPIIYKVLKEKNGIAKLVIIWSCLVVGIRILNIDLFLNANTFWSRIPIFIFGVYAGKYIQNKILVNKNRLLVLSVITLLMMLIIEALFAIQGAKMAYSFWPRIFYGPLALSFMVILLMIFEAIDFNNRCKKVAAVFRFIGTISLEIYLTHVSCIKLFGYVAEYFYPDNLVALFISNIMGIVFSCLLSYCISTYVNRKIKLKY